MDIESKNAPDAVDLDELGAESLEERIDQRAPAAQRGEEDATGDRRTPP